MLPSLRPGVTLVVAASLSASLLLGDQSWTQAWRLDLAKPLLEQAWTVISAPFCLPEGRLFALLPHLLVQWWIGGRLEVFWGTRRYLFFVLCCALLGTAAAGLAAPLLPAKGLVGGPVAIDAAVLLAFSVVFARERYDLPGASSPVGARPISALLGVAVLMSASSAFRNWEALLSVPVALIVAVAFVWQPWRRGAKKGKLGRAGKGSHLRVVRSADDLLN